jgi:hypothetical protein
VRCEYQFTHYDDNGDDHLEPRCCTAEATYVSCQPFVGTKTCEKHKCRCAEPMAPNTTQKQEK